uniref:LIM zinc-binding domain-containing protein n=1 Tax=Nothoprocta perdicaria TaxID=30464 RepID=A0A8C6Z7Y8_NOTPE
MNLGGGDKWQWEVCTSCLQPVYSRERVASDKVCLHHSCFCCQVCRKKLSLQNYAALHGVFYCQLHYKQMIEMKSGREMGRAEHQLIEEELRGNIVMHFSGMQPHSQQDIQVIIFILLIIIIFILLILWAHSGQIPLEGHYP